MDPDLLRALLEQFDLQQSRRRQQERAFDQQRRVQEARAASYIDMLYSRVVMTTDRPPSPQPQQVDPRQMEQEPLPSARDAVLVMRKNPATGVWEWS